MCHAPLVDLLIDYLGQTQAPFYFPGHKRGQGADPALLAVLGKNLFSLDLPELPGIDQVTQASESLAAQCYGVDHTWFLVNGATVGIQAALLSVPGELILVGGNAHRSTIAGLILSGQIPVFLPCDLEPESGLDLGVNPATLEHYLQNYAAKAVLLVSPNYFGVVGEIKALVETIHRYKAIAIIDAAHGAHLGFHPDLPQGAIAAGADLVIHSSHKMLTSLSQSAMLHLQGDRLDPSQLSQALGLLQTSSPNLILLASLDAARYQLQTHGFSLLDQTLSLAHQTRSELQAIAHLQLIDLPNLDPTRHTHNLTQLGLTGFGLDQLLRQQHRVIAELPTFQHLVFALGIGTTQHDTQALVASLGHLPADLPPLPTAPPLPPPPSLSLSPRQAYLAPSQVVEFSQSAGQISQEIICPYPPGIPILFPGQRISPEAIAYLQQIQALGGQISGASDPTLARIRVTKC
ncbi:MAG: aminotransferase class V-fold PLP-dependent enzyme [Pseudanabaenaceae cyanobacterium bins.68]|nr:aminotransferase class V-fold PLP-dependent enzyme [Pseudanabaenaceae cyanobacterium bins.68]